MIERVMAGSRRGGLSAERRVGFTAQQLRSRMEDQFLPGMSWDNYGTHWQIDHIASISELMKAGVTDPKIVNGLNNLRPLWKGENMKKNAKFALGVKLKAASCAKAGAP